MTAPAPMTPETEARDKIEALIYEMGDTRLVTHSDGITYGDLRTLLSKPQGEGPEASFQARVQPWMMACFGPEISADKLERGDRLLEETLELLQSGDYPPERAVALVGYVFGRPKGEPRQEAGGVMVTLAAYCLAHGLDMHEAGEVELARISAPEVIEKIRVKQAAKPTGSALPTAQPQGEAGVGEGLAFKYTDADLEDAYQSNRRLREALDGVIGLAENFLELHLMEKAAKNPAIIKARAALSEKS